MKQTIELTMQEVENILTNLYLANHQKILTSGYNIKYIWADNKLIIHIYGK